MSRQNGNGQMTAEQRILKTIEQMEREGLALRPHAVNRRAAGYGVTLKKTREVLAATGKLKVNGNGHSPEPIAEEALAVG